MFNMQPSPAEVKAAWEPTSPRMRFSVFTTLVQNGETPSQYENTAEFLNTVEELCLWLSAGLDEYVTALEDVDADVAVQFDGEPLSDNDDGRYL